MDANMIEFTQVSTSDYVFPYEEINWNYVPHDCQTETLTVLFDKINNKVTSKAQKNKKSKTLDQMRKMVFNS